MKCPDCLKEVKFTTEYCPHCSADLFAGHKKSPNSYWGSSLINRFLRWE